jgi:hypothetical protein
MRSEGMKEHAVGHAIERGEKVTAIKCNNTVNP